MKAGTVSVSATIGARTRATELVSRDLRYRPSLTRNFANNLNSHLVCPLLRGSSPTRGVAPKQHRTRRLLTNRPCSSLVYEESDSKERLRVSNWIVQRLYNYAVKKTVEL